MWLVCIRQRLLVWLNRPTWIMRLTSIACWKFPAPIMCDRPEIAPTTATTVRFDWLWTWRLESRNSVPRLLLPNNIHPPFDLIWFDLILTWLFRLVSIGFMISCIGRRLTLIGHFVFVYVLLQSTLSWSWSWLETRDTWPTRPDHHHKPQDKLI